MDAAAGAVPLRAPAAPPEPAIDLRPVPCPKCHGVRCHPVIAAQDHLYGVPGVFTIAACAACGFWFQSPSPAPGAIAALYPADYGPHTGGESAAGVADAQPSGFLARRLGYAHLRSGSGWRSAWPFDRFNRWRYGVNLTPTFVADGALLEIGCSTGGRLEALRKLGWRHLEGVELVPAAAAAARTKGFTVHVGAIEALIATLPPATYDVIIASMLIEHVPEPFRLIEALSTLLKPGGELLFSTVCRDALTTRWFGASWAGFDLPRHLVHFTRADLRELVAGFARAEFHHQPVLIDFTRSVAFRKRPRRLLDRLITVIATGRAATILGVLLAALRLTPRVSVRCRRP